MYNQKKMKKTKQKINKNKNSLSLKTQVNHQMKRKEKKEKKTKIKIPEKIVSFFEITIIKIIELFLFFRFLYIDDYRIYCDMRTG